MSKGTFTKEWMQEKEEWIRNGEWTHEHLANQAKWFVPGLFARIRELETLQAELLAACEGLDYLLDQSGIDLWPEWWTPYRDSATAAIFKGKTT